MENKTSRWRDDLIDSNSHAINVVKTRVALLNKVYKNEINAYDFLATESVCLRTNGEIFFYYK